MRFYVGTHQVHEAGYHERCMISVNRLRDRQSPFQVQDWIMDSGAFTELATYGHYRTTPKEYVKQIKRWHMNGRLRAIVSQDYMCEPAMLKKTGLSVREHQRLTIERFREIRDTVPDCVYVMPVLQGYTAADYVRHIDMYGEDLPSCSWCGIGSVCKRQGDPEALYALLNTILDRRPELMLHGFGVKRTAFTDPRIVAMFYSADSMAWSFAARRQGRDPNDWNEAAHYTRDIERLVEGRCA